LPVLWSLSENRKRKNISLGNILFVVFLCWAVSLVMANSLAQCGNNTSGIINPRTGVAQAQPMIQAKTRKIYYENTIKDVIRADCSRCHSGPTRNLIDYDSLKAYADSGLLATMVQGPMRRFAGNDAQMILTWIDNGAPEKPGATKANFAPGHRIADTNSQMCQPGVPLSNMPNDQITYNNTIKHILTKDCLRCHSGHFRNLTTYKNVKMYVDNGLLKTLVRIGGHMHRFAGPDSRLIIDWINNGAPQ